MLDLFLTHSLNSDQRVCWAVVTGNRHSDIILLSFPDVRLNPRLQKSCELDIKKFCKEEITKYKDNANVFEGKVLMCLRKQFVQDVSIKKTKKLMEKIYCFEVIK